MKVARATTPDGKDPGVQGEALTNTPTSSTNTGEKEVRRAEAVRPLDLSPEQPTVVIPAPKPAEF